MKRRTRGGTWHSFNDRDENLLGELVLRGAALQEAIEMVACDKARDADIEAGRPYYDYEAQTWRNVLRVSFGTAIPSWPGGQELAKIRSGQPRPSWRPKDLSVGLGDGVA